MINCPHCGHEPGHHAAVQYRCWDTGIWTHEDYWFCHTCAALVYATDDNYEELNK